MCYIQFTRNVSKKYKRKYGISVAGLENVDLPFSIRRLPMPRAMDAEVSLVCHSSHPGTVPCHPSIGRGGNAKNDTRLHSKSPTPTRRTSVTGGQKGGLKMKCLLGSNYWKNLGNIASKYGSALARAEVRSNNMSPKRTQTLPVMTGWPGEAVVFDIKQFQIFEYAHVYGSRVSHDVHVCTRE